MSQKVIALKLSSSEEIIARVEHSTDEAYTLSKPMMIGLAPSPDGSGVGIQMMPWVAANQDGSVHLFKSHIVAETTPHEELEKGYIQQTTGIALT